MNRLTKPNAQMLLGIARKPVGADRPSADWAFFIGVALAARYTSTTMADKARVPLRPRHLLVASIVTAGLQ